MTIEIGGKTFKQLKWTLKLSDPSLGSDLLGSYQSGPFTIIAKLSRKGFPRFEVFVSTSAEPAKKLGPACVKLSDAKSRANAHAVAALAFGPHPITVSK